MLVHLIDFDSAYNVPNVALMKISAYHKSIGNEVRLSKGRKAGVSNADKIYISCIYKKNKPFVDLMVSQLNNDYYGKIAEIDVGGSGIDLHKRLPPEIECMKPDYSLYPKCDSSIGFSSRGCIRKCSFCVVPEKEGKFIRTDHPTKWYDPEFEKIVFLDNNILADKEWFFELINWCLDHKLKVRFLSGYDIRLVDKEIVQLLFKIQYHHVLSFAWDNIKDEDIIREKIQLLKNNGFTDSMLRMNVQFYVYVDSDDEYESGLYRCKELKKLNCNAYVMYNIDNKATSRINDLKRWSKGKMYFWGYDFEEHNKWIRKQGIDSSKTVYPLDDFIEDEIIEETKIKLDPSDSVYPLDDFL